ncbi:MAG TPA: NAD(P)-dependent oxidoreductase [Pseudonocardiaceae bacterium]
MTEFAGRTLLITGGAGFLGTQVLRDLRTRFPGRIVCVQRRPGVPWPADPGGPAPEGPAGHRPEVTERLCDLRDAERWHDALRGADYVLWMAALRDHAAGVDEAHEHNVAPLRAALETLRGSGRLRRFVFTSSISAVDQPWHPARPRPIHDGAEPNPCTPYGASKLAAERALAASGLPHTTLRLPFLYGPGWRRSSFLDFYLRAARTRWLGALRYTATLSLLYTGDVARLVLAVLSDRNAAAADASPYVVSDGRVYEVDDLVSRVARLHDLRRPRPLPAAVGRLASALALGSRAVLRRGPVRRGPAGLLGTYWSHAAFTRDFFTVDAARFHAAFPDCAFTPLDEALARSYGR